MKPCSTEDEIIVDKKEKKTIATMYNSVFLISV